MSPPATMRSHCSWLRSEPGGGAGTSEESVIDVDGMVCISTHIFLCAERFTAISMEIIAIECQAVIEKKVNAPCHGNERRGDFNLSCCNRELDD